MRSVGVPAARRPPRPVDAATLLMLAVSLGALTGALAVARGQDAVAGVIGGAFAATLILLAWGDLRRGVIPNRIVYPAIVLALMTSFAWPDRGPVESLSGFGVAVAVATLAFLVSRGGLGAGDVKMMALVGAVVGYPAVLFAGMVTVLTGGVAAVWLVMSGRAGRRAFLAYAPFIALGGLSALLR